MYGLRATADSCSFKTMFCAQQMTEGTFHHAPICKKKTSLLFSCGRVAICHDRYTHYYYYYYYGFDRGVLILRWCGFLPATAHV